MSSVNHLNPVHTEVDLHCPWVVFNGGRTSVSAIHIANQPAIYTISALTEQRPPPEWNASDILTPLKARKKSYLMSKPLCVLIARPNGAGKTTFGSHFLPHLRGIDRFVNVDLIAAGISPLAPERAAVTAGRVFLEELDRLARARERFGFESTLSGLTYAKRLGDWRQSGYRLEIIFLWLPSAEVAKARVRERVRQGGHSVPEADIVRRYQRGWKNFQTTYAPLADAWSVFDNSVFPSKLIDQST